MATKTAVIKRGEKGHFLPGTAPGPGNPLATSVASWRAAMARTITEADVVEVWKQLIARARKGEQWAVVEFNKRTLGDAKIDLNVSGDRPIKAYIEISTDDV
jgi:hypothetical protein